MCILCNLAAEASKEPELLICICGQCGTMILALPQFMELHEKFHATSGDGVSFVKMMLNAGDN